MILIVFPLIVFKGNTIFFDSVLKSQLRSDIEPKDMWPL
jgi:hypothetical protein